MSDLEIVAFHSSPRFLLCAVFLVIGLTVGCERPFVEPREPVIEIASPDLSVVQPQRNIVLEVRVTSQNGVDSVLLNGLPFNQGTEVGLFSREIKLDVGLSRLVIQAFDVTGVSSRDTVYAVALPAVNDPGPLRLPEPRGGHTALRMADGSLMIAGGSPLPTQPASNAVWIYPAIDLHSAPSEYFMLHARTEHTATLLPDGRVLILGGSVVTEPTAVSDLVEEPELFDPDSSRFVNVPVAGDPIRRSGHTTTLFQVRQQGKLSLFLYLYGGWGDIEYSPASRLGIRSDLRVFQFRNDSLVAVGPTIGPNIDSIVDQTATAILPQIGSPGEYLVAGTYFASEAQYNDVVFQEELSTSTGITLLPTGPMHVHRSGHAAARMVDGEIFIFGGRTFGLTSAMRENEVYYSQIRRFFPLPDGQGMIQKRWGHTATNWDGTHILIIGGFGDTGAGLQTSEWYEVDRTN